ncbi:hypothetical protein DUI87_23047 [Hirundo rustica rustica]|uniref:Uncharacterized protein n=1 Tax=Hirundo rustica rustica TaxID=333673 RepID=A0A3M0JH26_HIRRU|nr:hypothetical protein DUI87_23047 [Hirundo rustica rustica]
MTCRTQGRDKASVSLAVRDVQELPCQPGFGLARLRRSVVILYSLRLLSGAEEAEDLEDLIARIFLLLECHVSG